ncbi:MAG: hypothetical protein M1831_005296 [Alyxoria varia]|nr:MAG: hypothetical protein M1831_005296 [Alyxoria varia]
MDHRFVSSSTTRGQNNSNTKDIGNFQTGRDDGYASNPIRLVASIEDNDSTNLPPFVIKGLVSEVEDLEEDNALHVAPATYQRDIPTVVYRWDIFVGLQRKSYEELIRQEPAAALEYVDEEGDKISVRSGLELGQRLDEDGPLYDKRSEMEKFIAPETIHVFDIKDVENVKTLWRQKRRDGWRYTDQEEGTIPRGGQLSLAQELLEDINVRREPLVESWSLEKNTKARKRQGHPNRDFRIRREFALSNPPKSDNQQNRNPAIFPSNHVKGTTQGSPKLNSTLTPSGQRSVKDAAARLSSRNHQATIPAQPLRLDVKSTSRTNNHNPWASYKALPSSFGQEPVAFRKDAIEKTSDRYVTLRSLEYQFWKQLDELQNLLGKAELEQHAILGIQGLKTKVCV